MIDYKKWMLFLIIGTVVVLILASCTTSKDNKAFARVTGKPVLLNKAGREWEKSNPCVVDTVIQFKNGVETIRYDTLWNDVVKVYYDTATRTNTVTEYKTIVKNVVKTDTILIDKTDVRRLNLALSDNDKLQAENNQVKSDNKDLKSKLNKRTLEFWGLIVLIAGAIGLKFYLK
jgi:hypothetical protein